LIAEAECEDRDGMPLSITVFAGNDERDLVELEVRRADGLPIRALPPPESMRPRPVGGSDFAELS
jgi:hypothetical protein